MMDVSAAHRSSLRSPILASVFWGRIVFIVRLQLPVSKGGKIAGEHRELCCSFPNSDFVSDTLVPDGMGVSHIGAGLCVLIARQCSLQRINAPPGRFQRLAIFIDISYRVLCSSPESLTIFGTFRYSSPRGLSSIGLSHHPDLMVKSASAYALRPRHLPILH
jgi:hypothetical protein